MTGTIIYLVISFLASLIFIIIGTKQYKSEKPVSINTGEKPPREDELTSVTEWNHRHGRNFIIFGCTFFITQVVFLYFVKMLDSTIFTIIFYTIAIFAEIAWIGFEDSAMKKKMIKK